MLSRSFGRSRRSSGSSRDSLRTTEGSARADLAAEWLRGPAALMQLSRAEARQVVSCMLPMRIPAGNTFIRQGDQQSTGFMPLVPDGEVTVDTIVVGRTQRWW